MGSAQKASPMLFYFYLFWCYFLLCAGKQTAAATHTSGQGWAGRECKASRRGEKEKSNYTAQWFFGFGVCLPVTLTSRRLASVPASLHPRILASTPTTQLILCCGILQLKIRAASGEEHNKSMTVDWRSARHQKEQQELDGRDVARGWIQDP